MQKIRRILKRIETKKQFFACVVEHYSILSKEYRLIELAYDMAKRDFADIYRDGGALYLTHPVAVAVILMEYMNIFELDLRGECEPWELLVAALLHDSVEDLPDLWNFQKVKNIFGYNVAVIIDYVSKPPKKLYKNKKMQRKIYHQRFKNAPYCAILLKLVDRWHNQLTLWDCSKKKVKYKLKETNVIYMPLARKYNILTQELTKTVIFLRKRVKKYN